MLQEFSEPKHTVLAGPEGLSVSIPSRGHLLVVLMLSLWLCAWAVGEVSAGRSLVMTLRQQEPAAWFLAAWLGGWTLVGGASLFAIFWQLAGREVVTVSPSTLSVRRQLFGVSWARKYPLAQVKRLRVEPRPPHHDGSWNALAFDYGAAKKTARFGSDVGGEEAGVILRALVAREKRLG